ncbi:MAG: LysM peptidoglycan-binding domain-containing protein [Verrucomicrobiota bacterium]|jgi:tetratricopeptide (TPR) repeat protein|nr:LysM peptidoglycan-binding domain-containing protein [Verrucomicrobiota bacterium]
MKWAWDSMWLLAGVLLFAAGCARAPEDKREARNPMLRRAIAARQAQDIDRAIEWCEKALRRKPDLALAHRELAVMLDNYRQDYIPAMYHYQRYLDLHPESEQREAVEELLRHCRVAFATQVVSSPEEMKRDLLLREERIRELELEVVRLSELLAMAPSITLPSAPAAKGRSQKEGSSAPAAPAGPPRTHVVHSGENLATISKLYYGTPARWKQVFNANRDQLSDANNLRVGTTLVIPSEE